MKRFLPTSIAGQTIIVLFLGLTFSHVISMALYSADRSEVLTLSGGRHVAHRIAAITRLLEETPEAWRDEILHATDSPSLGVTMTPVSQLVAGQDKGVTTRLLGKILSQAIGGEGRKVNVQLLDVGDLDENATSIGGMHWQHLTMSRMMHEGDTGPLLRASVQLNNGQWVNFVTAVSDEHPLWSSEAFRSMVLMATAVILLSLWVIQRVTKPLRLFAAASERLGKNVNTEPLEENGPDEIVHAAQAFNEMQSRLQRLIENRTRMLAAISHDLRTPITLMRLRAEYVENTEEREKMLSTLGEMEQMISATLSFAREDTEKEEPRIVDLGALVSSIADDLVDMGKAVECETEDNIELSCRPVALRRAISNVIENAVKYGGNAQITVSTAGSSVTIVVEDTGPGVPEEEIPKLFAPFYRVESSRSRETGGVGLGLSVAMSIINNHGGDISVENRTPQGLRVVIALPR